MKSSSGVTSLFFISVVALLLIFFGCQQRPQSDNGEPPLSSQARRPILTTGTPGGLDVELGSIPGIVDVVYPAEVFLPWGDGEDEIGLLPPGGEQRPEGPYSLAADIDGTLWVLDQINSRLVHLSPSGDWLGTLVAPPGAADLYVGPNGRLFVLSLINHRVTVIDSDDMREHVPIPMAFRLIAGIMVDNRGHLLLISAYENTYDLGVPGSWIPWPDLLHTAAQGIPGVSGGPRYQPVLRDGQAALLHHNSQEERPEVWLLPDTQGVASVVVLDSEPDGSAVVLLERMIGDEVERGLHRFDFDDETVVEIALPPAPYTHPFGEFAVGRGGVVHQLYSLPDGVHIRNYTLGRGR